MEAVSPQANGDFKTYFAAANSAPSPPEALAVGVRARSLSSSISSSHLDGTAATINGKKLSFKLLNEVIMANLVSNIVGLSDKVVRSERWHGRRIVVVPKVGNVGGPNESCKPCMHSSRAECGR